MSKLIQSYIDQIHSITSKFCIDGYRLKQADAGIYLAGASGNCSATTSAFCDFAVKASSRVTPRGKAFMQVLDNSIQARF